MRRTLSELGLLLVALLGWASLVVVIPLIGFVDAYRAIRARWAAR